MNTHRIIKSGILICMGINASSSVCGDNASMNTQYSWFDILSGRKQQAEKEALEKKIAARVNIPKIKINERVRIEKLAKKKLSPKEKQQLEEEIIKNQEAAISAARNRAQTEIEKEESLAVKQKQEEADKARALKRFELRKKSHARLLRKAPYGDLEEYAYLEAEKKRKLEKQREKDKEENEIRIWNTYLTDPTFIQRAEAESNLSIAEQLTEPIDTINEKIVNEAKKLATEAYYRDFDKREAEEQQRQTLEKQQRWKDRRAKLGAVKSGITTKVNSFFDSFNEFMDRQAKKAEQLGEKREASARAITAKEKTLGSYIQSWMPNTQERVSSWRSHMRNQEEQYKNSQRAKTQAQAEREVAEDMAFELYKGNPKFTKQAEEVLLKQGIKKPTKTQLNIEADRLAEKSYTELQKLRQQPIQQPTWGQRISNWWSGLKQHQPGAQEVPYKIWLMRPR